MNEYIILKANQLVCKQTYLGATSVLAFCKSLPYDGARYTLLNIDNGIHYNFTDYNDLKYFIYTEI